jgi:hypothetical protein
MFCFYYFRIVLESFMTANPYSLVLTLTIRLMYIHYVIKNMRWCTRKYLSWNKKICRVKLTKSAPIHRKPLLTSAYLDH